MDYIIYRNMIEQSRRGARFTLFPHENTGPVALPYHGVHIPERSTDGLQIPKEGPIAVPGNDGSAIPAESPQETDALNKSQGTDENQSSGKRKKKTLEPLSVWKLF